MAGLGWGYPIFERPAVPLRLLALILTAVSLSLAGCDIGKLFLNTEPWQPAPAPATKRDPLPREACDQYVSERQALFGDLHLHTALSMDANALGTKTLP
ncbi:MAG: DUF3604 domain-containing protein, partial [Luminiphilus sp.]